MIPRVFSNLERCESADGITLLFHQICSGHHEYHLLRIRFDILISFVNQFLIAQLRKARIFTRQCFDTSVAFLSKHSED